MTPRELTNRLAPFGVRIENAHLCCVDSPGLKDADLVVAKHCTGLEGVVLLNAPNVTGSFLEHLTRARISRVHLYDVPVTDRACEHLTRMPMLESVVLRGCHISADGLTTLSHIPQLHHLDISTHTPTPSPHTLFAFQNHPHLQSLSLEAPGATLPQGLRDALRSCLLTITNTKHANPFTGKM